MLEMLLKNQGQWKAEQRPEMDRMAAKPERMVANRDHWAAKRPVRTEQSTVGPTPNIHNMVDRIMFCGGATEQDRFLDVLRSNFNSEGHPFPSGGPDYVKLHNLSPGRLE